jgi:hypothetical protein
MHETGHEWAKRETLENLWLDTPEEKIPRQ